jgi:hypothetical protein
MADTAVTIAKNRVVVLTNPEQYAGFTHKFNVKYTDIALGSGSTDTVTQTLFTTPAKWLITQAVVNVTTAFAGTGGLTIKVGGTTTDAAIAATSVLTAGVIQPTNGTNSVNTPASATATAAQTIKAIYTNSTSGSPSALSAGECDIYLSVIDTSKLP